MTKWEAYTNLIPFLLLNCFCSQDKWHNIFTGFSCFRDPIYLKHLLPVVDRISGSHQPRSCTAALPQRWPLGTADRTFTLTQSPWHRLRWETQQPPKQWVSEASHCCKTSSWLLHVFLIAISWSCQCWDSQDAWCYHKPLWLNTRSRQSVDSPQGSMKMALVCSSSGLEKEARVQPESLGLASHRFHSERLQLACPNLSPQVQNQLLTT